jgi:hypothetical protein
VVAGCFVRIAKLPLVHVAIKHRPLALALADASLPDYLSNHE